MSEAEVKFLPKDMACEIRLIVDECVDQFASQKQLLHYQRLSLFRGLVAYLYEHAQFPLLEKYILCITLHEAVQAIMDLEKNECHVTFNVEPWRGEYL